MILYNASTSLGLRNKTRFLTRTDDVTYTDADLDANLNNWLSIMTTEILSAIDGWDFKAETATAALVAGQQEYTLPTDILKIKRIEVTYDGTNWRKANFFDINERDTQSDATTVANEYNTNEPYVDLMDESVMLYPVPTANQTTGIKIWYEKDQEVLAAATDEPAMAKPFQLGLCYGAAKDYFESRPEKAGFSDRASLAERNLNKTISSMKTFYNTRNQDRDFTFTAGFQDYDYDMNKR